MRIISGKFKGKKLISPKNTLIRPTLDRSKEMIFNTLNSILNDKQMLITKMNVLDLFCGTGALGIESISRGASSVTFIDKSKEAIDITKNNCINLNISQNVSFIKVDLFKIKKIKDNFNLFFIDAPYKENFINKSLELITSKGLANSGALGVIEFKKGTTLNLEKSIKVLKEKKVGISQFIFCEVN